MKDEPDSATQSAIDNFTHPLFSDAFIVRFDDGDGYADKKPGICIDDVKFPNRHGHRLRFEVELRGLSMQEIFSKVGGLLCVLIGSARRYWDESGLWALYQKSNEESLAALPEDDQEIIRAIGQCQRDMFNAGINGGGEAEMRRISEEFERKYGDRLKREENP